MVATAALLACNEPQAAAPPAAPPASAQIGAVRVHSALSDAQLFIDAHERGPLRDGMEVELPPGAHVLEARRGGAVVATLTVEVRAALLFEATLDAPAAIAAAPGDVAAAEVRPAPTNVEPVATPDPSLPATPTRNEIAAAMRSLSGPVEACTAGENGIVAVRLTFGSDGQVREARATSPNLAPAQQQCVLDAARRLRISAFAEDQFVVTYPVLY